MSTFPEQIVPWGRTAREYELMFSLTPADLAGGVLDCGGGPSGFTAEMAARGHRSVAVDPIYARPGAEIRARFDAVAESMVKAVRQNLDSWNWSFHRDPEGLLANRRAALETFLADYEKHSRASATSSPLNKGGISRNKNLRVEPMDHPLGQSFSLSASVGEGRGEVVRSIPKLTGPGETAPQYIIGQLPKLPFESGTFGLAVCSHLLFLYSDRLTEEFHVQSVRELCRVAREVRIFPLLTLEKKRSPHFDVVRSAMQSNGWKADVVKVDYEFQRGGNEMLRVYRK